ncbi:MAG: hypothetical protein JXA25_03425 [Anaerolineales bacterium]|nr:hypothetical protein [Anaerolineales bacterium]
MGYRHLRLVYPPSLLNEPILSQLMKASPIHVNIIRAHITLEEGWLEIELSGSDEEILWAVSWLNEQGLQIIPISPEKE